MTRQHTVYVYCVLYVVCVCSSLSLALAPSPCVNSRFICTHWMQLTYMYSLGLKFYCIKTFYLWNLELKVSQNKCVCACVHTCVCVWERETEKERKWNLKTAGSAIENFTVMHVQFITFSRPFHSVAQKKQTTLYVVLQNFHQKRVKMCICQHFYYRKKNAKYLTHAEMFDRIK